MAPTDDQLREILGGDMPSATLERLRAFLGLPSSFCSHSRLSLDVGRDLVGGRIQILDWCLDCGALRIRDEQEDVSSDWVIPSENAEASHGDGSATPPTL